MSNLRITLIVGAVVIVVGLFAASFVPGFAECRASGSFFQCAKFALGIGES